ncbi:MAG: aminotransferase class IV, partial [Pseudomonadota bacterium]|nr:aminotransferase class IV [Pseudomonadota bacterium]
ENVLARLEWHDPLIFEGVMRDTEGDVIEGVSSNLVFREGENWYTPDLSMCGVAGVQRSRLMELVQTGIKEVQVRPQRLLDADEVMICNSVMGLLQIREMEDRTWGKGKSISELRALLEAEDEA